ncbi:MAG: hypothetical protein M1834_003143 [Cirrosporium novae-zelandiae]|nr:MAG: hypothetical protein M1834_003143 [Cirrosporium novae-zelandiae]
MEMETSTVADIEVLSAAKDSAPNPTSPKGAGAFKQILAAGDAEAEGNVADDPLGSKKGHYVSGWPIDTGSNHHDQGRLVALKLDEMVIASPANTGEKEIRIHTPRRQFRVKPVSNDESKM